MRLVRVNERQIGTVAWRLGEKTALYATALPSISLFGDSKHPPHSRKTTNQTYMSNGL
jgi:hypothetical protein